MAKILVIDDDQLFVTIMVHALKQRGHDVAFAFDGVAGADAFAAAHFDAVVCDIVMPLQEGVATIRQFRNLRPDVAIVGISGGLRLGGSLDILEVAQKLGADVTLKKPFQISSLSEAVERALATPRDAGVAKQA